MGIEIRNLTYRYPERAKPALKSINLSVSNGDFVLLVGPSGGGKSTLIRAINGLVPHFYGGAMRGKVEVNGMDTRNCTPNKMAEQVGIVFQDPENQLVMTKVENEISFGLEIQGLDREEIEMRVKEALEGFGLNKIRKNFTPQISGGEKQRLVLASILALKPKVLVLDEPTSQLDPKGAEELLGMLIQLNKEHGITVIIAEHRLERCFEYANKVVLVENGEMPFSAPPKEFVRMALKRDKEYLPPVSKIFHGFTNEIAISVEDGRRILSKFLDKIDPSEMITWGEKKHAKGRPILQLDGVFFKYPNNNYILKGINLKICEGERVAIVGKNGSGKSTLVKHFNGLLRPDKGKIILMGINTKDATTAELSKYCGFLSQNPNDYLFEKSVEKEIDLTLRLQGIDLEKGIESKNMVVDMFELEKQLEHYSRDLSCGERQRVALASVIVTMPRLLVLDEPTRGMDYERKMDLGNAMKDLSGLGIASVVVTHDVEYCAEHVDRIIILEDGKIVADGAKKDVFSRYKVFAPQVFEVCEGITERLGSENFISPIVVQPDLQEEVT